jgi:hypothetical protein
VEEDHLGGAGRWEEEGHEEPLVESPEEMEWQEGVEGESNASSGAAGGEEAASNVVEEKRSSSGP